MRKTLWLAIIASVGGMVMAACTAAHENGVSATVVRAGVAPAHESLPAAVPLWPNGAPGSEGQTSPENVEIRTDKAKPHFQESTVSILRNIHNPSITPFLPDPAKATGVALIIAPGGGFEHLSIDREGYQVARYMAAHGIAGFVLKYRLSRTPGDMYKTDVHALMDAQRAVRLVRSRAAEWHVDPDRVGMVGFSAGGTLTYLTATHFKEPVQGTDDAVDKLSCRLNFQGLIYGGGGRSDAAIDKDLPPTFMAAAADDRLSTGMPAAFAKLREAGISAELHIYARGGHGFGMWPTDLPAGKWADEFVDWMKGEGLLSPATATQPTH
jgi:endo-1,4-beta-xylanase